MPCHIVQGEQSAVRQNVKSGMASVLLFKIPAVLSIEFASSLVHFSSSIKSCFNQRSRVGQTIMHLWKVLEVVIEVGLARSPKYVEPSWQNRKIAVQHSNAYLCMLIYEVSCNTTTRVRLPQHHNTLKQVRGP